MVVRNAVGVDFSEYKLRDGGAPAGPPDGAAPRAGSRRPTWRSCKGSRTRSAPSTRTSSFTSRRSSGIRRSSRRWQSQILPAILKDKPDGAPIRIWVAGCSTGEEVYSLAIALLELLDGSSRPVQIFGSDLSEPIIAKARAGLYRDARCAT